MKIEKWEIENLKRVLEYWDTLSNNTEALDCMTDHCHTEFHDAEGFIEKLETIASQLEPLVMQKIAEIKKDFNEKFSFKNIRDSVMFDVKTLREINETTLWEWFEQKLKDVSNFSA